MFTAASKGNIFGILRWQWKKVLLFAAAATVTVVVNHHTNITFLHLPPFPLAVVGGAIGIFVSFRSNSAYDRWWEGRKLWGRLINTSRHLCSQATTYIGKSASLPEIADAVVRRHIAYVHVLRCLLRGQPPLDDEDVTAFLTDAEQQQLASESNMTHALLQLQLTQFTSLADEGKIDGLRLQSLDETVRHLLDIQGGCERIQKTPLPRGYAFVAERLIAAFAIVMPLAMVDRLGWLTIPIAVLVCLAFALISEVGRVLEDPFTLNWPALPLFALSKTIELNLRQRLGDAELPALPKPSKIGVLM